VKISVVMYAPVFLSHLIGTIQSKESRQIKHKQKFFFYERKKEISLRLLFNNERIYKVRFTEFFGKFSINLLLNHS
jgi:hypothetical protein